MLTDIIVNQRIVAIEHAIEYESYMLVSHSVNLSENRLVKDTALILARLGTPQYVF